MGREQLTESSLPNLPKDFVEHLKRMGKQGMTLSELIEELKTWQGPSAKEVSAEDREFVREELAWLAEWVLSRYPKLNYEDIRRFLTEMVSVSV
jgi:hypothetical protein